MAVTFKIINLAAVASLALASMATANEAFLSDNFVSTAPTRINQILVNQPRVDTQVSETLMSKPSAAFSTTQFDGQINAGDQSVEDVVSILLRVQQQRLGTNN